MLGFFRRIFARPKRCTVCAAPATGFAVTTRIVRGKGETTYKVESNPRDMCRTHLYEFLSQARADQVQVEELR